MHSEIIRQVLEQGDQRRDQRRAFLKAAGAAGAAVAGGAFLASCNDDDNTPTPTPTPTPSASATSAIGDFDILNFALNLEYLEAEFYLFATTGAGIPDTLRTSGTGAAPGTRLATGARAVAFTDPIVRQYAREIAADELAHVRFLRTALGNSAVAEPSIDVGVGPNNAFSNAARAAGLIGAGATFDPYASDEAFLIGAFIFEDVGVTAYKGAAPLLTRTYIEAAAGILAAEAYHAGLVRTVLYRKGIQNPGVMIGTQDIIGATEAISNVRDAVDNSIDVDQGIRPTGSGVTGTSNLVPTDSNGIVFSRSAGDVLNIVYLTATATSTVAAGSFFPNGVNGRINASSAFA